MRIWVAEMAMRCPECGKFLSFPNYGCDFCGKFPPSPGFEEPEDDEQVDEHDSPPTIPGAEMGVRDESEMLQGLP
jgi:hypothetical protein